MYAVTMAVTGQPTDRPADRNAENSKPLRALARSCAHHLAAGYGSDDEDDGAKRLSCSGWFIRSFCKLFIGCHGFFQVVSGIWSLLFVLKSDRSYPKNNAKPSKTTRRMQNSTLGAILRSDDDILEHSLCCYCMH